MSQLWTDLSRLNRAERAWLVGFSLLVLAATCYFSATGTNWNSAYSIALNWLVSPISAISGVLCVVLVAKGLISNWVWGLLSCACYGLVAWTSGYYGDWLLNWFYFVPSQFFVWWCWKNQLHSDTQLVRMRSLGKHSLWLTPLVLLSIGLTGWFLTQVDGFVSSALARNSMIYQQLQNYTGFALAGPVLDASTVVFQVAAQLLMIRFFAAQWTFWLLTNLLNILAWTVVLLTTADSAPYAVPTLLMWIAFFINSVYGAINWSRGAAQHK
ncbi:nicotinamide riboside transporter PnuC [Rheinheimera sp.]|uniref:nicotinamide riboside transporter PnuC n=1 Tax=Rheinheimera sp. TaxID=1869214 RepID=UPI00307F6E58